MRVLIVEDEQGAAENIKAILHELDESIQIVAIIDSVDEAARWIQINKAPDLGFFDIQLADGFSFEIFEKTDVNFPVVFTTAFDEYAIKAFKVNSIDYILKPLNNESINFALTKYKKQSARLNPNLEDNLTKLLQQLGSNISPSFKRTLLVPSKDSLIPVEVNSLAFIYIDLGIVFAIAHDSTKYKLDQTLDILEEMLNPSDFFRINRQCIVSRKAIKEISYYFSGRFKLNIYPHDNADFTVSKSRVASFRKWMDK